MNKKSGLSEFKRCVSFEIDGNNAFFLWGPRKVGKTTFLKEKFPHARYYDFLKSEIRAAFTRHPELLREEVLATAAELIIIDEVQKIPAILDEVHWCLENTNSKFILCGSSARKLKRGAANLLGGRAWRFEMFPLTLSEIPEPDILRACHHGLFPQHYISNNPIRFLKSYISDYLNEEIQAEANLRNVPEFSHFLELVSTTQGQLINYANIARQCGVSAKTVRSYFQILEDTLIGFTLPAWTKSNKYRLIETAKFYMCDPGLVRYLLGNPTITTKTDTFGRFFEHILINEIRAYLSYREKDLKLSYWRTSTNLETDLIIGNMDVAIEFKSSSHVDKSDLKGIKALKSEYTSLNAIVVSMDREKRQLQNGICIFPWEEFCTFLWEDKLI